MFAKHEQFNKELKALLERTALLEELESEMKRTFGEWDDFYNAQIYGERSKVSLSIETDEDDGRVIGIDFRITYPKSYGERWEHMIFFLDGTCYYKHKHQTDYSDYLNSRLDEIAQVLKTNFQNPRVYGRD